MSNYKVNRQERIARINHALELRKTGASYRQIADSMNEPISTVFNLVKAGIKFYLEEIVEKAEEITVLETMKLDRMELGLYKRAVDGDGEAIDRVLRIMQRRAKLLGLDAPERREVEHNFPALEIMPFDPDNS